LSTEIQLASIREKDQLRQSSDANATPRGSEHLRLVFVDGRTWSPMGKNQPNFEAQTNDVRVCSSQDRSGSTGEVGKGQAGEESRLK
jgi:hypothetical protein